MSTLKVSNIQQADAPAPNITLLSDGSVTIPLLSVALGALSDVELETLEAGELLVYDGAEWQNTSANDVVDGLADARIAAASLADLSDVEADDPAVDEALVWDGSAWQAAGVATELDDLSDVEVSDPQEGEALVYDGNQWVADTFVPTAMERVVVDDDTTVTLADRGMVIALDSEDPHTVTVPLDATLLLPVGTIVNVYRAGDGDVEVVGEAGVTVRNAGSISEQFGEVSLRKRAANEWVLVGEVDEP